MPGPRIHLNGYVPTLQVDGQVVSFMTTHLGYPIPSLAIMEEMGPGFRRSVRAFADTNHIPVVRIRKRDRKIDLMGCYLTAQGSYWSLGCGRDWGWPRSTRSCSLRRSTDARAVSLGYRSPRPTGRSRASPSTCGTSTSGPRSSRSARTSPARSENGSTAMSGPNAKRQATAVGIGGTALSNGFATCHDPVAPGLIGWYSRQGFKSTGGQDSRLYMKTAKATKNLETKLASGRMPALPGVAAGNPAIGPMVTSGRSSNDDHDVWPNVVAAVVGHHTAFGLAVREVGSRSGYHPRQDGWDSASPAILVITSLRGQFLERLAQSLARPGVAWAAVRWSRAGPAG